MKQPMQPVTIIKTKDYAATKIMRTTWINIASRHVAIAMVSVIYDHEQYHNNLIVSNFKGIEDMTTINYISTL